jgi:hypothetical protein
VSPESTCWNVQRLAEALQLLCRAYDLAPGTAIVLNLLAHHCLLRGDYDKARSCSMLVCSPHVCRPTATHVVVT